jgi:hypothetical protein
MCVGADSTCYSPTQEDLQFLCLYLHEVQTYFRTLRHRNFGLQNSQAIQTVILLVLAADLSITILRSV